MPATCLDEVDAVILAGGQGTRLRALFPDRPKCLVPIRGVPFLGHCLAWLRSFGARRVILSLGYRADMVRDYLRSRPRDRLEVETHVETTPLGTGGGLRAALSLLRSATALVLNGDSFSRADLPPFLAFHRAKNAAASLLLAHQTDVRRSGHVAVDATGAVTAFVEKPTGRAAGGHVSAGVYFMQREVVAAIPGGRAVSLEKEVFPGLCGRGLFAMPAEFPFIDIGTPDSYGRAEAFFAETVP